MGNHSRIKKRGNGDFHQSYRPCRISEVYGQDEIKEVIRKGLDEGSLAHAILFHGVSGTGKTTLGRIIAMGLNCEEGPTSEPCCECPSCRQTMNGNSLSFLEMNSADFTGIDHIRKIRSEFHYATFDANNRIYLFDECHGLTSVAQNALLKSVEDSKEHLYFMFCSTEPEKILETLRNRCMSFELKEVQDNVIWKLMADVIEQEGYDHNEEVMDEIIRLVKGKPRNALNELQKAIAAAKFDKHVELIEKNIRYIQKAFQQI